MQTSDYMRGTFNTDVQGYVLQATASKKVLHAWAKQPIKWHLLKNENDTGNRQAKKQQIKNSVSRRYDS